MGSSSVGPSCLPKRLRERVLGICRGMHRTHSVGRLKMACCATISLLERTKLVIFISEKAIARSDRVIQSLSQVLICGTDYRNAIDNYADESSPPPRLLDRRVAYPTQLYLSAKFAVIGAAAQRSTPPTFNSSRFSGCPMGETQRPSRCRGVTAGRFPYSGASGRCSDFSPVPCNSRNNGDRDLL